MTSRQGGGSGGRGGERAPSSPSSGSEENGFVHRPRVAGLYANLSREELDRVSEEGIYGPSGDPNERREVSGSQRSLNLPSVSTGGHPRPQRISRTPQPPRRSAGVPGRRGEKSRRPSPGRQPGLRSAYTEEFSRGSVTSLTSNGDPRGEAVPFCRRPTDFGPSANIGPHALRQGDRDDVRKSPPPYAGLGPCEYEYSDSLSPLFPRCGARPYANSQYGEPKPRAVLEDVGPGFATYEAQAGIQDDHFLSPPETESHTPIPSNTGKTSPAHGSSSTEVSPRKKTIPKPQDGTRLRPPLAGIAGTSADSGTGDSGSAEIQADVVGTPQPSVTPEILTVRNSTTAEKKSPVSSGKPGTGKQTVKPFTKESLDRLENRTVQLVREYGFQPRRKTSVEDGAVLPHKFEPFPADLYGRPLEEIDNFIYDEVRFTLRSMLRYVPIHIFTLQSPLREKRQPWFRLYLNGV